MSNNSVEQVKKIFTDILADQFKKISELYDANEKHIAEIINKNNQIINERLDKLSETVKANANIMKQLTNRRKDLKENLIVNQDLIEEKITIFKNESKEIKNETKADKTELKEQMRIQEDRSRRKNIRIDGIEKNDSVTWVDTEAKLKFFFVRQA